jgi:hypothetical protein
MTSGRVASQHERIRVGVYRSAAYRGARFPPVVRAEPTEDPPTPTGRDRMDKSHRPIGITALAFVAILVGLYSQVAALALLVGGVVFGLVGTASTTSLVAIGAVYFGLMVAAYLVGFGLWMQRHWSWAGAFVVFAVLIAVSFFTALVSGNTGSAVVPMAGAGIALAYLFLPSTRARLLGTAAPQPTRATDEGVSTDAPALDATPSTR